METEIQPATQRLLKAFSFMMYGSIAVYSTFFALYLKQMNYSELEIGTLLAGGPVIAIIANPIWGYWADRLGDNRRILIMALVGNFIAMQIIFALHEPVYIYAALLVFFIFQSPLFTQNNSLILNVIEGTKLKFGSIRMWGSLGWAFTAAGAGPIIGVLGIHQLWIVFDAMMIAAIGFGFLLPKGKERVHVKDKGISDLSAMGGFRQVLMKRSFLFLLCLGVVVSVPNSFNNTYNGIYIQELGGSSSAVGWSIFATAILEAPVYLLLDRYMPTRPKAMMGCLVVVSALYSVRWLLMGMAESPVTVIWIQLLHCITFGGYYYIGTQLTMRLVPIHYRSTGQAIYGISWGGLSGLIAGIAGGSLYNKLGPQVLYQYSAVLTLVGAVGFVFMMKSYARAGQEREHDTNRKSASI
ncbi:PPP family 3-phenylpropionic acid transporter [Paenibacillus shirakamiensis]|uniref:PPP family 3-phenylpropionic acid transporter n=1 Tax=Paenibacillus shirakamiensis TaxID=1265935 RepID=A0ABS4JJU1_9BACL|nr:MFS transporter [Paenibacillus shirakamiensis]MBP2001965.1 PPP family 3-phenylpropionic acid transporter [Paenibacillus shirakamiensis]